MKFIGSRTVVVRFVDVILMDLALDLPSITITKAEPFGDFFVSIATDMSSEDTVLALVKTYSLALTRISQENIQDG